MARRPAKNITNIRGTKVFRKFGGRCFKCGREMAFRQRGLKEFEIDHTLPMRLLWPATTDNATLLCKQHNAEKSDRWPSEFYSKEQLQRLSVLTGIPFQKLSGPPVISHEALDLIRANVDTFLAENIRHPRVIRRVRELIRDEAGIDIKEGATNWPSFLNDDT